MSRESYENFKKNITPLDKYASGHKKDMKKTKPRKRKFFFLFDRFQLNLKEEYNITEYDMGLLVMLMAHQRFREYEETHSYIHYKGKRATPKDIQEILRLNHDQVKHFKRKMINLDIIREDKYGIYLNDRLTVRGKKTTNIEQFNRIYVDEVKEVYDIIVSDNVNAKDKKQAIKDVGLLFLLIPFMNKKTNELVDEHFNNITMNELRVKLGLGKNSDLEGRIGFINQSFHNATGRFLIYKLEPVGIVEGRSNKKAFKLIINPRLVFSSDDNDRNEIYSLLFDDTD